LAGYADCLAGYADCLAGFIKRLGLEAPHVAGLSFGGILALELYRQHPAIPATLILVSAYAGWAGSLPAEVTEQRLQQALVLAELSPEEFVAALLPTMFSQATPPAAVEAFGASMLGSTRPASGPWRGHPPRTCAASWPISASRRCWCTATGTCGHP
jgi:pimeloyl-ACP methyl ester carboxylesterase